MPGVYSKDEAKDEEEEEEQQEKQLRTIYRHVALNLAVLTAPFTQRADLFVTFPEYKGKISLVSAAMGSLSAAAALFEFFINPLCGKLSDAHGRKLFMLAGPLVNLLLKAAVFLHPTKRTIGVDRIVGSSMSTVAGTTCAIAAIADLFAKDRNAFAKALGGISNWVGIGLIAGPLLGSSFSKMFGSPKAAYLASAVVAVVQIFNILELKETLPKIKRRAFKLADASPLSFLRLLRARRQLLILSVMSGALQRIPEGKNLADVHQSYSRRDVGMTASERSNFVSFLGICLLINARTSRVLLPRFGGRAFTSFANICNQIVSFLWYSTIPVALRKSWTMYVGALIGCPGWSAHSFTTATATAHAVAAGWGRGEFSAALANMRALTAVVTPLVLGKVYAWSTSGGRSYPGLAYQFVAISGFLTECVWRSLGESDLVPPSPKEE